MNIREKFTKGIAYAFPVLQLIGLLIIAAILFGTFKLVEEQMRLLKCHSPLLSMQLAWIDQSASGDCFPACRASADSLHFRIQSGSNIGYYLNPRIHRFFTAWGRPLMSLCFGRWPSPLSASLA